MTVEEEIAAAAVTCEECGRGFLSDRARNAHHCSARDGGRA